MKKKFDEKQGKTRETFLAFPGNNPIKEIFAQVRVCTLKENIFIL